MDDQIGGLIAEQDAHRFTIPNIQGVVTIARVFQAKSFDPRCDTSRRPEELGPEVVINPDDLPAEPGQQVHALGPDQSTGSGDHRSWHGSPLFSTTLPRRAKDDDPGAAHEPLSTSARCGCPAVAVGARRKWQGYLIRQNADRQALSRAHVCRSAFIFDWPARRSS